jgi:hypothetical protein
MRGALMPWGRLGASLVGGAIGAALLGPSWAQVDRSAPPSASPRGASTAQARVALVAPGDPPDLFLLYSGDVIGYLDPCG